MLIFINVLLNTCHVNFSIVSIGAWFSIKKEHIHEKKMKCFFFFFRNYVVCDGKLLNNSYLEALS